MIALPKCLMQTYYDKEDIERGNFPSLVFEAFE